MYIYIYMYKYMRPRLPVRTEMRSKKYEIQYCSKTYTQKHEKK